MSFPIADIMTTSVISLSPTSSLKDAHDITKSKGIRHLPVTADETGKLVGIVTQKAMIAKVFSLLNLYGKEELAQREQSTNVMEIAMVDYAKVKASDGLLSTADFFLDNKHGCLVVVDDDEKLCGIVTSSDFVRLSAKLLQQLAQGNK